MPWCIPSSPSDVSPQRKKHPISTLDISPPIPQELGGMYHRSPSALDSGHRSGHVAASNSNTANTKASGNTIKRRPVPPLHPPIDEVGITSLPATSSNRVDPPPSVNGRRPVLGIKTAAPFSKSSNVNDDNGSAAHVSLPRPLSRFDPMRAFRHSFRGSKNGNDDRPVIRSSWINQQKGKDKMPETIDDDEELEETSLRGNIRASKIASKAKEIRAWMKGKSGSQMHHSASFSWGRDDSPMPPPPLRSTTNQSQQQQQQPGGVRDLFRNRRSQPIDRGPKAGQTYEIVGQRIIERNPEKTVEISTWRENAARESRAAAAMGNDAEKMSIYFIGPDDYPQEGEYASEASARVEWRGDGGFEPRSNTARSNLDPADAPARQMGSQAGAAESTKLDRRKASTRRHGSTSRKHTVASPKELTDGTISPSTSEKDRDSDSLKTPCATEDRDQSKTHNEIPTPVARHSRSFSYTYSYTHGTPNGVYYNKESTPLTKNKDLPPSRSPPLHPANPPFHPTRSGSTISSIKSASTIELQAILATCEPSLVHITQILQSLGIRNKDHLKAVAKLTPNTRDREVREGALRLGITVMEWAILLDKILTL